MPSLDEAIDALIARAERDKSAAYHLSRLRAFLGHEVEQGVSIDVDVDDLGDAHECFAITITTDFRGFSVKAVEPAPPLQRDPDIVPLELAMPKVEADTENAKPAPSKVKRGDPWSPEDDATVIRMAAASAPVKDIAKAVSRTVDATKSRMKNVLRQRISAAKGKPHDAHATTDTVPPEPSITTIAPSVPSFSPLAAIDPDNVTDKIMLEHLHWFYQSATPDPDVLDCDLELCEALGRGDSAGDVADHLCWTKEDVIDRFKALLCGHACTLKLQMSLLVCLRRLSAKVAA